MKRFLIVIMSVAVLASCANLLDVKSGSDFDSTNMWANEELAQSGINGLYINFYSVSRNSDLLLISNKNNTEGIDRISWAALEFQSEARASSQVYTLTDATKRGSRFQIQYDWQWAYTGIHRINDAIENLYKAGMSTDKYENMLCEAKFLRAWYYFYLNRIYQGVPIYLKVVSNEECTEPQSTSTEVWNIIIDDLTYCIDSPYVPDNTLTSDYGRPSKGAAYSLRGMAYMWLAWENNDASNYYQLAANDFEKVSQCGYGLFTGGAYEGTPVDFYNREEYEHNQEMIFPIQFDGAQIETGDYIDLGFASHDAYNGWTHIRPSYDFVTYFQNADGSKFNWVDAIPEWNDDVFVSDISKREVFFLRNKIATDGNGTVLFDDSWPSETAVQELQARVDAVGADVFEKYYLKDGNEERLRKAFDNRDTRFKQFILTPYEDYITYNPMGGDDEEVICQMRWPVLSENRVDGEDLAFGSGPYASYLYKKFVLNRKGQQSWYFQNPHDWPLIHFTDVYLYLAECYVHLGNTSAALNIVNEVRSRAGMPAVSSGSTDEVMEAVRYERRVELCGEGTVAFDEWRWGTYKEMKFQGKDRYGFQAPWGEYDGFYATWYYDDCMWPWTAPADECNRNRNISLRDGWTD